MGIAERYATQEARRRWEQMTATFIGGKHHGRVTDILSPRVCIGSQTYHGRMFIRAMPHYCLTTVYIHDSLQDDDQRVLDTVQTIMDAMQAEQDYRDRVLTAHTEPTTDPRCTQCGAKADARIRACHHDARLRWETDLCHPCWKDAQERANHTELVAIGPPGTNPNGVTV